MLIIRVEKLLLFHIFTFIPEQTFMVTVNQEILVYENIHVLNTRVNKFSRVPHENILTRKFVKLKLLCMYHRLSDY